MLELAIRKSFDSFTLAVDARAFEGAGRVLGVFGPSGSGKTTLLNCIAGIASGVTGRIVLDGRVLTGSTGRRRFIPPSGRGIGYVFQDALLFPHLTVERNLRYGQRAGGSGPAFAEVVEVLRLGSLLSRPADALSGGEARRVALGRAMLAGPSMLLLDEPLAGLDRTLAGVTLHYIQRTLARFDLRAVYVTHSAGDALFLCDRVWVMEGGRVTADGPPRSVIPRAGVMDDTAVADLENVFEADREEVEAGASPVYRIGDHRLVAATSPEGTPHRVLLSIHAADIMLARHKPQGLSARNILPGRIVRLSTLGRAVIAFVDVGVVWMVALTPAAVSELELREGVEVFTVVKASAVSVLSGGFT